jgi:hypothetical protein
MYNYIIQEILNNVWKTDLYGDVIVGFAFDGDQYFIFDAGSSLVIEVFQIIGDFTITQNELKMTYSDYEHRPHSIVLTQA